MIDDPSEHLIQVRLVNELEQQLRRDVLRFAIPNGGLRNGRVASKMKAEGLKPGMPDLGFAVEGGRGLWLEMKKPGGSLSLEQKGVRYRLEQLGHLRGLHRAPRIGGGTRHPLTLFVGRMDVDRHHVVTGIQRGLQGRIFLQPQITAEPYQRYRHRHRLRC